MIVDKRPGGVDGELTETLTALRNQQILPTRLVLGMRDISMSLRKTRETLRNNNSFEIIREYYDEVWIYGSQAIFDTVNEYGFPAGRRAHYSLLRLFETTYSGFNPKRWTTARPRHDRWWRRWQSHDRQPISKAFLTCHGTSH